MDAETTGPRDSNHIWLRQSVTFSVNGQTRTVEMALPLRPGATPREIEALLDEADAGMRRLSSRLDAHITTLLTTDTAGATSPIAPARAVTPQLATPPNAIRETPATPTTSQPTASAKGAPFSAEPEMSLKQFIEELKAIGMTPTQAMKRLGVASLSGLNLREALESLHRQSLQEGAPTPATPSTQARPSLTFEEEDDGAEPISEPEFELSYLDSASLTDEEDEAEDAAESSAPAPVRQEQPDLAALRRDARLTSAAQMPQPTPRRASPLPEPEPAPVTPAPEPEETPAERAARTLSELRALSGGGTSSDHQRAALKNVVTSELTERGVEALTRALWNLPPDEMGPEQYDALISWGKHDHFKDEAREVLKIARVTPMEPAAQTQPAAPAAEVAQPDEATPPARATRGAGRARSSASSQPAADDGEPRGAH